MVILRTRNKITDFFMILAWASPFKSKRQDGSGVSPLEGNGQLNSDSRRKVEILIKRFCPVFTSEDTTNLPKLPKFCRILKCRNYKLLCKV